jgi:hypothetical protein
MAQTSGPISGLLKGHGPNIIGPKIWAVKRPRPKQILNIKLEKYKRIGLQKVQCTKINGLLKGQSPKRK